MGVGVGVVPLWEEVGEVPPWEEVEEEEGGTPMRGGGGGTPIGGGGGGGCSETASDTATRHSAVQYSLIQAPIHVEENSIHNSGSVPQIYRVNSSPVNDIVLPT